MREIIAPDGPIMQFFAKILDMVIVSILFTVTCIPVITVGCALASLYDTAAKSIKQGEGQAVKTYFHCFRVNFRQGLGAGILCDLIAGLMFGNLYLVVTMDLGNVGLVFGALFLAVLITLFVLMSYGFPLLSRYEVSIGRLLVSSFQLSVLNGPTTFRLAIMEMMLFGGMVFAFLTFPPLVIIWPGLLGYAQVMLLEPILQSCCSDEDLPEEK